MVEHTRMRTYYSAKSKEPILTHTTWKVSRAPWRMKSQLQKVTWCLLLFIWHFLVTNYKDRTNYQLAEAKDDGKERWMWSQKGRHERHPHGDVVLDMHVYMWRVEQGLHGYCIHAKPCGDCSTIPPRWNHHWTMHFRGKLCFWLDGAHSRPVCTTSATSWEKSIIISIKNI